MIVDYRAMERRWLVLITVSVVFFFISGATFMSLGVLLAPMARDLHWTQTEAGAGYTALGLSCCLSSLLPMALAGRIGMRWTMMLGGLMLAAGFLLSGLARGLGPFVCAAILMGVGFTLTANIPGVYLLARWFPAKSGRVIGAYLMCGAFGGVAGPPIAQAVMASQGWRAWWMLLAVIAAVLGGLCAVFIRETQAEGAQTGGQAASGSAASEWRYRDAILTPQFAILALGMVITEACVTVVHSAVVIHFSKMGLTPAFAAIILSLQAAMATAAKGASGAVGDSVVSPRLLLAGGLGLEALGMMLLASVNSPASAYAFALAFGVGWGTAYLTVTVLLIDYFGARTGSAVLSLVWLLTAFASLYPTVAGVLADRFGSFSPAFDGGAALLAPLALAVLVMRRPVATARRRWRALPAHPHVVDDPA